MDYVDNPIDGAEDLLNMVGKTINKEPPATVIAFAQALAALTTAQMMTEIREALIDIYNAVDAVNSELVSLGTDVRNIST
jgi:hypothetical protein